MPKQIHECSIDETQQGDPYADVEYIFKKFRKDGIRTLILDSPLAGATVWGYDQKEILNLATWLYYGSTMPSRSALPNRSLLPNGNLQNRSLPNGKREAISD